MSSALRLFSLLYGTIIKNTLEGIPMPKRKCKSCGRKMKQQFIGVYHCKCGNTRMNGQDMERTSETVFALERKQVGQKMKQVPVIRSNEKDVKEEVQLNLYFAIYKNRENEIQHIILYRKSKKMLRSQLKNKGFEVLAVFNKNNVADIKAGHFHDKTISESEVDYFKEHISQWDLNF